MTEQEAEMLADFATEIVRLVCNRAKERGLTPADTIQAMSMATIDLSLVCAHDGHEATALRMIADEFASMAEFRLSGVAN